MRYFLDTEFIERGPRHPIELVSIAVVAEDRRELYRISTEFNPRHASGWVKSNVLRHLPERHPTPPPSGSPRLWMESEQYTSRKQIADDLLRFVSDDDNSPEFWGYFSDYDWVAVCQLYGDMSGHPSGWPYYCRNLKQLIDERGLTISQDDSTHDALGDTRWVRDTYDAITARAAGGDQ